MGSIPVDASEWVEFFRVLDCMICAFEGALAMLVVIAVAYSLWRHR